MTVTTVPKEVAIYQPLLYKLITKVDGIPTPTLTEWLVALERAWSRGVDTIALTVYDDKLRGLFHCLLTNHESSCVKTCTTQSPLRNCGCRSRQMDGIECPSRHLCQDGYHLDTTHATSKKGIADNRNFSMFFDGYAMSNDLPVALLVLDGKLVTRTLDLCGASYRGQGEAMLHSIRLVSQL